MSKSINEFDVIVVGCGISGLTSALELIERGFRVKIIARELPPNTTSDVAAAFWYPYRAFPFDRVLKWSQIALERYYELADEKDAGIIISSLLELYADKVDNPWWTSAVRSFRRAKNGELPRGYKDGYVAEIPIIESSVFLQYLVGKFISLGGEIEHLPQGVSNLSELTGNVRLIVNCSGLGARELCDDEHVFPVKGQVVRTEKNDLHGCILDEHGPASISYIVPRQNDCILGGTACENDWDLTIDPLVAQNIIGKCGSLVPELANVKVLGHKIGLRPARNEIRLELEKLNGSSAVIHNYGHGGAGFTVSWGCAQEVADLAESFARNQ